MKFHIVLVLVGLAVAHAAYNYDPTVLAQVLENPRLINAYLNCLLGTGSCTREGTAAKKIIHDMINTSCANCSEQDKMNAAKIAQTVKNKFPEKYDAVLKMYDPSGTKLGQLDEFIKQYGS